MAKPVYTDSTATADLKARQKKDYEPPTVKKVGVDPTETSDNGFVGVDPIYQNFANETDKPLGAEGGPEKKEEARVYNDDTDFDAGATPEGEAEAEEEAESDKQSTPVGSTVTTPTSGSTPPGAPKPPTS